LAQSVGDVASTLENHAVVLRNYYTDPKLAFNSDGDVMSAATPGFGPSDGRVYVEKVKLKSDRLTLTGKRTAPMYDHNINSFWLATLKMPVTIEILLPAGVTPQQMKDLFNTIFMRQSELDQLKCSTEDTKVIQDGLPGHRDVSAPAGRKEPDVQTLQELTRLCFPDGERAYKVGRGITAPKALHAPDPSYDERARQDKLQGTVVLSLIIDTLGRPSTLVITRPLGEGLDEKAVEAVRKWKFEPATFHGAAVPVSINVEVNFRLY
jgi:TonB family protein